MSPNQALTDSPLPKSLKSIPPLPTSCRDRAFPPRRSRHGHATGCRAKCRAGAVRRRARQNGTLYVTLCTASEIIFVSSIIVSSARVPFIASVVHVALLDQSVSTNACLTLQCQPVTRNSSQPMESKVVAGAFHAAREIGRVPVAATAHTLTDAQRSRKLSRATGRSMPVHVALFNEESAQLPSEPGARAAPSGWPPFVTAGARAAPSGWPPFVTAPRPPGKSIRR